MLHSSSPVTQVILPLPYIFLWRNNNVFIPFGLGHQAPREVLAGLFCRCSFRREATKLQPEVEMSLLSELPEK